MKLETQIPLLAHKRNIPLFAFLLISLITFLGYYHHPVILSSISQYTTTSSIPRSTISSLLTELSLSGQQSWNQTIDGDIVTRLPNLDETKSAYISRLTTFIHDYFPSHLQPPLLQSLERLSEGIPPPIPRARDFPHTIYASEKDKATIPEAFDRWVRTHHGWEFVIMDDEDMRVFMDEEVGESRFAEVFTNLPRAIYKSDTMRYLLLLLKGGVYTDSDTAPLAHALTWGHDAIPSTPDGIDALTSLITSSHDDTPPQLFTNHNHPILDPTISAILAVEQNAMTNQQDRQSWGDKEFWMISYPRPIQICQWTMMSKPFHPIFLDVLYHIVHMAEGIERDLADGVMEMKDVPGALTFTGPAPFTDSVFRYLMVQYGYNPRYAPGGGKPAQRIGDVLLLKEKSFGGWQAPDDPDAKISFEELRPDGKASVHGFKGRWRHDDAGLP